VANPGKPRWAEFLCETPLGKEVQADIARLHSEKVDYLPALSTEQKKSLSRQDQLQGLSAA
jgi:hypothetical protein